ncbi:Oidioi.mRNA.OKI2018_I69.chr1.g3600.t1.cds [Oikopleura dioica]|uniref:Inhibitor of growth protein n=1 Tax=Oikopleura dioica TaxID=34765 RepID=A0ABN7SUN2_OIKDI|nr:Oidioi.mRNA.OKI2018_I69.chr1.g3600.t1.cds [Oikopleura dioica]
MISSVLYLEQFIESLDPLPGELAKSFKDMREMDVKVEQQKALAENMTNDYNKRAHEMAEKEMRDHVKQIEAAWQNAAKWQDEKVSLATATYEMVDKHIRRLDSDLSRFESELAERGGLDSASPTSDKRKRGRPEEGENYQLAAQDVLDMPVDPNEPTYCSCHQVSYGEMIGCDNPDCPIEWFHFGCVGLVQKPKGKWYCARCKPQAAEPGPKKKKK